MCRSPTSQLGNVGVNGKMIVRQVPAAAGYIGWVSFDDFVTFFAFIRIMNCKHLKMLLGRKDFVSLKVGGITTVREATKHLEKDKDEDVKWIFRRDIAKSKLKPLSADGKANEKLYYIKEDEDLDIFDGIQAEDT